ncbi:hypothetical protein BOH72_13995 [Mycobacterium sp. WY10]|nr:hypothetical protein BOH72_13995 [Mycobacterium sp. WY10]
MSVDSPSEVNALLREQVQTIAVKIELLKMLAEKSKAESVYSALGFASWEEYLADVVSEVTAGGTNSLTPILALFRSVLD